MKILLSMFLTLGLVACSGSKSTNETTEADVGVELAQTEEFSDEFEGGDVFDDSEFGDALSEDTADSVIAGDQEVEMSSTPLADAPVAEAPALEIAENLSTEIQEKIEQTAIRDFHAGQLDILQDLRPAAQEIMSLGPQGMK